MFAPSAYFETKCFTMAQYGLTTNQAWSSPYVWKNLSDALSRNWFRWLLIGMGLYVLFNKDISIQFHLGTTAVPGASQPAAPAKQAAPQPTPTALQSMAPQNVSQTASQQAVPAAAQEKPWDPRQANDFSNLTFVLSPDYGKRHRVRPEIVRQKIAICENYARQYAPIAREEMRQYGVPASIKLAQALLESNAGESRLAQESNNHFGIKCRSKCRGCTCRNYTDDDIYDMFRVFDAPAESFREHSILLNSGRYKHLLELDPSDYKGWAHGLKKAGYATDKRYAQKIIQIIEFLELQQYDKAA
jgi:flagellum-specific peptidoglycan hydrolase FlgJ